MVRIERDNSQAYANDHDDVNNLLEALTKLLKTRNFRREPENFLRNFSTFEILLRKSLI